MSLPQLVRIRQPSHGRWHRASSGASSTVSHPKCPLHLSDRMLWSVGSASFRKASWASSFATHKSMDNEHNKMFDLPSLYKTEMLSIQPSTKISTRLWRAWWARTVWRAHILQRVMWVISLSLFSILSTSLFCLFFTDSFLFSDVLSEYPMYSSAPWLQPDASLPAPRCRQVQCLTFLEDGHDH